LCFDFFVLAAAYFSANFQGTNKKTGSPVFRIPLEDTYNSLIIADLGQKLSLVAHLNYHTNHFHFDCIFFTNFIIKKHAKKTKIREINREITSANSASTGVMISKKRFSPKTLDKNKIEKETKNNSKTFFSSFSVFIIIITVKSMIAIKNRALHRLIRQATCSIFLFIKN
jgi:hypothetical protein